MSTTRLHLPAEARRAAILEACRHLFAVRGYSAVSTADIAEASGVSWGLIAHYFGDKKGLYRAVLRSIAESTREPELTEGPLPERVRSMVEHGLTTIERSEASWLAVIGSLEWEHDPEIPEIIERGRERATDQMLSALGEDVTPLRSDERRALARSAVTLIEAGAEEWLLRNRLTRDQGLEFLTASIVSLVEVALRTLDRE